MNETKVVPVEPTEEMLKAGLTAYYAKGAGKTREAMCKAYKAMIAASDRISAVRQARGCAR